MSTIINCDLRLHCRQSCCNRNLIDIYRRLWIPNSLLHSAGTSAHAYSEAALIQHYLPVLLYSFGWAVFQHPAQPPLEITLMFNWNSVQEGVCFLVYAILNVFNDFIIIFLCFCISILVWELNNTKPHISLDAHSWCTCFCYLHCAIECIFLFVYSNICKLILTLLFLFENVSILNACSRRSKRSTHPALVALFSGPLYSLASRQPTNQMINHHTDLHLKDIST